MKKILIIIGSPKAISTNRMLSDYVKDYLKDRVTFKELDYRDLPMINPDIEFPVPEAVARIRQEFLDTDGAWIFFPEYNHSYPGQLKNLLDWISRPIAKGAPRTTAVSSGIPVTYSSVSGSGGAVKAFQKMEDLMNKIHMDQMTEGLVAISDPEVAEGKLLLTDQQRAALNRQAELFLSFIDDKTANS